MNSKRLYFCLIALLLALGSLSIGGIVFGNKIMEAKASQLTSLKIDTAALEDQQRSLLQAKKDINTYAELESIVKTIVPQEKDQAKTVREVIKIAEDTGIRISAISFPASTLGQPGPKSAPKTEGGATATSTKPSTTTQIKPVEGIAGLYQLEINIQSDAASTVQYQQFLNFLKRLEQNRRTAQVSNLTVQPSAKDRNQVSFSLTVNVYLKP